MFVPEDLSRAFGKEFQSLLSHYLVERGLIPDQLSLESNRYLTRSVVPHILKLSSLFNREEKDQSAGLSPYWKESSNPAHLRLAYFLYFMPCNLFRVASVWSELARLGYRWPHSDLDAVEFGAGPASGLCGTAVGEQFNQIGLPKSARWALIEQDKAILELGTEWAQVYSQFTGMESWQVRPFHRKLDPEKDFLPKNAPKFNLWLMSFYLNELNLPSQTLARSLIKSWDHHLEDEGLIILIEPALKLQSRKLLELRRDLLMEFQKQEGSKYQVLLPCLGHQTCGALQKADDWCHEEVSWWRPPYFRILDQMAGLDRKTLPFSYLVISKSSRKRSEILPALTSSRIHRLVSPTHSEGKEVEFFVCSEDGKQRTRFRSQNPEHELQRGSILLDAEIRGDRNSSRISRFSKKI
jgi:hypothetical protein